MQEINPIIQKSTKLFWRAAALMAAVVTLLLFIKNDPFHSASLKSILIYKIMPVLVTVTCFFISTRASDLRLKVMMLSVSAVVCSFLAEIGLIAFWQGDPILNMKRFQKEHQNVLGKQWEHLRELRKTVNPAYLYVTPIFHTEDKLNSKFNWGGQTMYPVNGISKARVVMANEGSGWAYYDADEYGFNNPIGVHKSPQPDVVLIGDSFTMGCCVDTDENLGSLIRQHYPKTVNLGRNGTGPLLQLAILEEYGKPLKPKFVVYFYYEGNDAKDLKTELQTEALKRYMDPAYRQNLRLIQPQINNRYKALHSLLEQQHFEKERGPESDIVLFHWKEILKLVELRKFLGLTYKGIDAKEYPPELEAIFLEMRRRTEAWGGRFIVVYLPYYTRLFKRDDGPLFFGRQIRDFFAKNKFNVIDAEALFKKDPDPPRFLPFRGPGHLNPDGYNVLAQAVVAQIQNDVTR